MVNPPPPPPLAKDRKAVEHREENLYGNGGIEETSQHVQVE